MNRSERELGRLLKAVEARTLVTKARIGDLQSQIHRIEDSLESCGSVLEMPYVGVPAISGGLGRRIKRLSNQLLSAREQVAVKLKSLQREERRQENVGSWLEEVRSSNEEHMLEEAVEQGISSQIHASESR